MNDKTPRRYRLVTSLFVGAFVGSLANVLALIFGHSFWMALLYHSMFGFLAMALIMSLQLIYFAKVAHANRVRQTG